MPQPTSSNRRTYLDWARGIAVLLMIEAHTFDAWTLPGARATVAFRDVTILGGFAAPLFLWLAGVGVVMAATNAARRSGQRTAGVSAACRRGLEIFILAFLFRLQGLIVSPGGHLVTLFRVDILNIMGPAMVVAALVWGSTAMPALQVVLFAVLAVATTMLTPIVRVSPLVERLPTILQWYVRPFADLTLFTLFPWAGFVFAGAACGVLLMAASDERVERRLHAWIALAGLLILFTGRYLASAPSIYRQSSFWTTSPTYYAIRVGILMTAVSALYGLARVLEPRGIRLAPLARFGRESLFVYWIHVELVYGYATWPIRHRLPVAGSFIACVLFTVLIYAAVVGKGRFMDRRRLRNRGREPASAA
ncbi:MAG: heparan-alpha-glucosaminide N-acetyltransferase domain-containing protein [Acidobacteriota bacterium]